MRCALILALLVIPIARAQAQEVPAGPEPAPSAKLEPVENRYKIDVPPYDRYPGQRISEARGPFDGLTGTEYPWRPTSSVLDPYNQNVVKGDLPIYGENTFFRLDLVSDTVLEYRRNPGATDERDFKSTWFASFELFYGDTVFRPQTFRLRITPALDIRNAAVVTANDTKVDEQLQEGFVEVLLHEFDPSFDFVSFRGGRQQFTSDFRGFVFNDLNQGTRIFGTAFANHVRYDLVALDLAQKGQFSNLNTFFERNTRFLAGDIFLDDVMSPGFTVGLTVQYVNDRELEDLDVVYVGLVDQGHLGPFELSQAAYLSFGGDKGNPINGRHLNVFGQFFASELALPIDWFRPKVSFLFSSGDANPNNGEGKGFDAVFENPDFAGGGFSYWIRHPFVKKGKRLKDAFAVIPALRAKGATGPNSVVPGLLLYNVGCDVTVSNTVTLFANLNYLRLIHTRSVEKQFGLQSVGHGIGTDASLGVVVRPLGIDNLFVVGGTSVLVPDTGLRQMFGSQTLLSVFVELKAVF